MTTTSPPDERLPAAMRDACDRYRVFWLIDADHGPVDRMTRAWLAWQDVADELAHRLAAQAVWGERHPAVDVEVYRRLDRHIRRLEALRTARRAKAQRDARRRLSGG